MLYYILYIYIIYMHICLYAIAKKHLLLKAHCTYINIMNFSRYFALILVEASKVGKDEHLRKVQSDMFAQLKHSKNKN